MVSWCKNKSIWQRFTFINETKFYFSDMGFKTLNLRFQTTWKPCFRSKMFVWFTTWLPCTVWANWCSLVAILWIATLGTWYSMKVFQIWAVTALEPSYRGLYQNRRFVNTVKLGDKEQISVKEQLYGDQNVPYHKVWLYLLW